MKDDEIFLNWKQENIPNEPQDSTKMKPKVNCPPPGVLGEKSVFAVVLGDYLIVPLGLRPRGTISIIPSYSGENLYFSPSTIIALVVYPRPRSGINSNNPDLARG